MSLRLAVHWALVVLVATVACVAAPLPFTGRFAGCVGVFASTAVAAIGYASAPTIGKRGRS